MRNINNLLECLLDQMDAKQLWHLVFNKMTNRAKRQMLSEIINGYLGGLAPVEGFIFEKTTQETLNKKCDKEEINAVQDKTEDQLTDTEKLCILHEKLLNLVRPFLSDFTGYNEDDQCFDITMAIAEILQDYKDYSEKYNKLCEKLNKFVAFCEINENGNPTKISLLDFLRNF